MALDHIPMYGPEEEFRILTETDEDTVAEVPLVVYVGGKRHVIGTATVRGTQVSAILGDAVSEELMDQLVLRPDEAQFSIGFTVPPNPYRQGMFDPLIKSMKEIRPYVEELFPLARVDDRSFREKLINKRLTNLPPSEEL